MHMISPVLYFTLRLRKENIHYNSRLFPFPIKKDKIV